MKKKRVIITRYCLVCDKLIKSAQGKKKDDFDMPPSEAVVWTSRGNYGSTVFDTFHDSDPYLEAYVCDECMKKKAKNIQMVFADQGRVVRVKTFDSSTSYEDVHGKPE